MNIIKERYNDFLHYIKKSKLKNFYDEHLATPFNYVSTIISWGVFVILILISSFLVYYFVTVKIYEVKGYGYEPPITLYTIISPSMVPNINVYDVVLTKKVADPSLVKEGDIISFYSRDFQKGKTITVTHRVVEVIREQDKYKFTTKGDNNLAKDPTPVDEDSLIGTVTGKIPQLGRVQFFLASGIGWILVIILPSLLIIFKEVAKLLKLIEVPKKLFNKLKQLPLLNKQLYLPLKEPIDDKKGFDLEVKNIYKDLQDIMNKKE